MSGSIAKKLRVGIIDKLKELDSYIDNELPDYIMVLIANKKTSCQMKEDLSLFVGDNVGPFVDWLHHCLDEVKLGNDPFVKSAADVSVKETTKKATAIINENDATSKQTKADQPRSDSGAHNSKVSAPNSISSGEESKENSKQKPARKLITFSNEDQPKRIEQSAPAPAEQPTKNVHKRIVFNSEDDRSELPAKKLKNEPTRPIVTNTSRTRGEPRAEPKRNEPKRAEPKRAEPIRSFILTRPANDGHPAASSKRPDITASGLESQSNFKQQLSNLQSCLQSNQYKKSYAVQQSNSSPSQYGQHSNNSHGDAYCSNQYGRENGSDNQKYNQLTGRLQPKRTDQIDLPRPRGDIRQRLEPKSVETKAKPALMFSRAMAEANKSSALSPVSVRKSDSDKPKTSLVERLGASSITAEPEEPKKPIAKPKLECDEEIRMKRLIKFNQPGAVAVQQAAKQAAQQTLPLRSTISEDKKAKSKVEEENMKKEDLRDQLKRKRKFNDTDTLDQSLASAKRSPGHRPVRAEHSEDKPKALKDEIRPKSQMKSQVLAESRTEDNQKEPGDDVNVIIKQELIKKMNAIEAKMAEHKNRIKQSGKELLSTKKERCRFWPVCTNQTCQYHHPTDICGQFPNCKFGSSCFFLHPPCKFDVNCTKAECPFAHSIPSATRLKLMPSAKPKLLSTIQKIPPFVRRNA